MYCHKMLWFSLQKNVLLYFWLQVSYLIFVSVWSHWFCGECFYVLPEQTEWYLMVILSCQQYQCILSLVLWPITIAVEKVLLSVVPLLVSHSAVFFFLTNRISLQIWLGCPTEISFWTLLVQWHWPWFVWIWNHDCAFYLLPYLYSSTIPNFMEPMLES